MNEIKVTVTYEKPTTSKFDALMAEYEAAKKYADETVAYYKPLANAAEDAKFDAIMAQLETIKQYAKRISDISGQGTWLRAGIPGSSVTFEVVYRLQGGFEITWRGYTFSKTHMHGQRSLYCEGWCNIIGNWDEWRIYEQLEKYAFEKLTKEINEQKRKANAEKNRLYNITKGGN
jgi:hypothetical protein